ncbi:reverse transcriptase family protein [Paenarthrobacter sp. CCNWLW172]|uniref:reverse transcriptase family protein n=1 Tax=unclassified Paenarthrobacter TaxID=2634190 RepID=UPI003FD1D43F
MGLEFLEHVTKRLVDPYVEFSLAKSDGSRRKISAPAPELAKAQRWILDYALAESRPGHSSFAYQRGLSARDCAEVHAGASWLIKLDLKDFFGSVDERRVTKIFRMTTTGESTSTQLAKLCTRIPGSRQSNARVLGSLPQGGPCSGMLANLVAGNLDQSLGRLASRRNLKFTRYSDDLTFSSKDTFRRSTAIEIVREARGRIAMNNFVVNEKKTRISPPGTRLTVMGLLVDRERPRLLPDFRKRLQWHVYGVERFGLRSYASSKGLEDTSEYLQHVEGLLAHAVNVDPDWGKPLQESWRSVLQV